MRTWLGLSLILLATAHGLGVEHGTTRAAGNSSLNTTLPAIAWQRRSWGVSGVTSFLPGEMVPDPDVPSEGLRESFKLVFPGFRAYATIQKDLPGEGTSLDKTVHQDLERHNTDSRYKSLAVKRQRISELKEGEMVVYDYNLADGPWREYLIVARHPDGRSIGMRWIYKADNPVFADYGNRILYSLEQPTYELGATTSYRVGDSDLWVESAKPLKYEEEGGWVARTRCTGVSVGVSDNALHKIDPRHYVEFEDQQFRKGMGATDYKSRIVPFVVNGVKGMLLKSTFRQNGKGPIVCRCALAFSTLDKSYLLDVFGVDEKVADKALEGVRLRLAPKGERYRFKESVFSVQSTPEEKVQNLPADKNYSTIQMMQLAHEGKIVVSQLAQHAPTAIVRPDSVAKDFVKQIGEAFKSQPTIDNSGWGLDGQTYSYWIAYHVDVKGKPCESYCQVVCLGRDSVIESALLIAPSDAEVDLCQRLLNSIGLEAG